MRKVGEEEFFDGFESGYNHGRNIQIDLSQGLSRNRIAISGGPTIINTDASKYANLREGSKDAILIGGEAELAYYGERFGIGFNAGLARALSPNLLLSKSLLEDTANNITVSGEERLESLSAETYGASFKMGGKTGKDLSFYVSFGGGVNLFNYTIRGSDVITANNSIVSQDHPLYDGTSTAGYMRTGVEFLGKNLGVVAYASADTNNNLSASLQGKLTLNLPLSKKAESQRKALEKATLGDKRTR
jgi:hypothetical protein